MKTEDLQDFQKHINAKAEETVLVLKLSNGTNAYVNAYSYDEIGEHCITDSQGSALINLDQVVSIEIGEEE